MPPPSDPSKTLTTQKSTFLTRQILLLSSPLSVSLSSDLPPTLIEPLLTKLNKKITSHNRLSFPLQSQRHVLEQVEGVYWRDVLSRGLPVGKCETLVGREVDFTGVEAVEGLGGWEDVVCDGAKGEGTGDGEQEEGGRARKRRRAARDDETHEEDEDESQQKHGHTNTSSQSARYQTLQTTLLTKIHRRNHLKRKLAALRHLKSKLEPFEDAQVNVQPNLMWKGNREVEGEIARMRVLLVRCGDMGKRRGGRDRDGDAEDGEGRIREGDVGVQTQTQRIEELLGLG